MTNISILGQGDFIHLATRITAMLGSKMNVNIQVFESHPEDSDDLIHTLLPRVERTGTDIIITGRFTKGLLESKTHIPVIHLHLTPSDILSAVKKSIPYSTRIAIAMFDIADLRYDYSALQDLLNIELEYITYHTPEELRVKIKDFSKTKGAVIGTGFAVTFAKQHGLQGTLIYTEKSILESIERAIEIIHFKREEEKNNQEFKAIINSVRDGIIATNGHDKITIVNDSARELLHLSPESLLGKELSQAVSHDSFQELANHDHFQDKIISFAHSRLNTNKTVIYQQGRKIGNVLTFQDITDIQKIEQKYRLENEAKGQVAKATFEDIICENAEMKRTIERAKKFSLTDSTVLIIGETGTGKELLAQSIHNHSKRKSHPFVAINCAALPETLLESQLFGYEDGAFTGASKNGKKGLFEVAHNGTVFLDEINSISLHFQARLLRVLQEKEVVRVGGNKVIPIDIRVLAAANEDLIHLVKNQTFRADLYYRLNVLKVKVPPLRNRLEDIPLLTKQFLKNQSKELYRQIEPFAGNLYHELKKYHYPGNIRELHNILERFSILMDPDERHTPESIKQIVVECMDDRSTEWPGDEEKIEIGIKESYRESMLEAERVIIKKYLESYHGDKSTLASKLGMGRTTFYRKLKELDITL
ncbi:sigma 54-interacting transcriptional regulator [Brevibacillus sp. NRS-1366]|uniref:sigma 54-interacting transcriptional regulator n=1 Tax=Brevibacillus sp. NRS-1366 TaxID=3233899 RepID=UPI003D1B01E6